MGFVPSDNKLKKKKKKYSKVYTYNLSKIRTK